MILHISDRHIGHLYRIATRLETDRAEMDRLRGIAPDALQEPSKALDGVSGVGVYVPAGWGLHKVDLTATSVTLGDLAKRGRPGIQCPLENPAGHCDARIPTQPAIGRLRKKARLDSAQKQTDLPLKATRAYE